MSPIRMIMLITCLRDPKSCWISKYEFKFKIFQVELIGIDLDHTSKI
jgi:hypothetical protein